MSSRRESSTRPWVARPKEATTVNTSSCSAVGAATPIAVAGRRQGCREELRDRNRGCDAHNHWAAVHCTA